MSNQVFEEAPQPQAGAVDKVRKQARQLAYDIRYKVKGRFKEGQKGDPGSIKRAYMQELGKSSAAGPVKQLAKKMLIGEEYDMVELKDTLKSSINSAMNKVFVEGYHKEEVQEEVEVVEEESGEKFVVRITDTNGQVSYRKADNAKIVELRKKPNVRSIEKTDQRNAKKGYDNLGKDYDGDGKVESGSKEHAGVVHNAIQRKKGGNPDGQDTRKEETEVSEASDHSREMRKLAAKERSAERKEKGAKAAKSPGRLGKSAGDSYADYQQVSMKAHDKATKKTKPSVLGMTHEEVIYEKEEKSGKKLDVLKKGDNSSLIKINPKLGEQAEQGGELSPEDKVQLANKKRFMNQKHQMQKKQLNLQKQGKLPMQQEECDCDEKKKPEAKKESPDSRAVATMVNLVKNKMRARGLNMSYDMEGESIDEVTYPSDFIDKRTGKKKAVATSKTGRPQQHDQPMSGGRRKTVDEKYQGMYQSPAPTHNRLKSSDEKARMSPGRRAMAKSDELEKSEPGSKRAKAQKKAAGQIARNFQSARMTKEETEDSLRDRRQERGGVDGNTRYDRSPKAPNTKKFGTGKTMAQKEMEKKYGKGATAMDVVRAQIRAKHGKDSIK